MVLLTEVLAGWIVYNQTNRNSANRSFPIPKAYIGELRTACDLDEAKKLLLESPGTLHEVEGRVIAYSLLQNSMKEVVLDNSELLYIAHLMPFPSRFNFRKGYSHLDLYFNREIMKHDPLGVLMKTQAVSLGGFHQPNNFTHAQHNQFIEYVTHARFDYKVASKKLKLDRMEKLIREDTNRS